MEKKLYCIKKKGKVTHLFYFPETITTAEWTSEQAIATEKLKSRFLVNKENKIYWIPLYEDYRRKVHPIAETSWLIFCLELCGVKTPAINCALLYMEGCSRLQTADILNLSVAKVKVLDTSIFNLTGIRSVKKLRDFFK